MLLTSKSSTNKNDNPVKISQAYTLACASVREN